MSTLRSTGNTNRVYSSFTCDVWWRPTAVGAQQRLISIGTNAVNARFYLEQTAAGELAIGAYNATGPKTDTTTMMSGVVANRLYHITITYDRGAISYRIASKIVWATGTATWTNLSIDAATVTTHYFAIGSTHHNTPTFPATGHLLKVFFSPRWIAAATSSTVYGIFEQTSGDNTGDMIMHSPITALGTTPDVYFGPTQTAAEWAAGTNRGSIPFPDALLAGTLADVGLSKRLAKSANGYIDKPYATDGTFIYAMPNENKMVRMSMAHASSEDLFTIGTSPGFKKEDGSPITNGGFYQLYKTRTGWLLQVLDTSTNVRRFYRTTLATLQSALPIVWPVPDLMPVLTLGAESATSLTGALYAGRRTLGYSSFVIGTFAAGDALYIGEYDGVATDASLPGNIWYSTDDGATWSLFWRFQNQAAAPASSNRTFRYIHGMCQLDTGELVVVLNGLRDGEHVIAVGPTATDWTAHNNKMAGTLTTDFATLGAPWKVIAGSAGANSDTTRWLQPYAIGDWIFGGNEETTTDRLKSGMYAVNKDGTGLTLTHRRPNMQAPNRTHAGGCIRPLSGILVSTDYSSSDVDHPENPSPIIEVRTSRDGFFWVPVATMAQRSGRTSISQNWTTFVAGSELVFAGAYQQWLTGASQQSVVVTLGAETGTAENLLSLNQ